MSYNIDTVRVTTLNAWMRAKDVVDLYETYEDTLAECNFLEEMLPSAAKSLKAGDPDAGVKLPNAWWSGEGSGRSYDVLVKFIAPKIMGKLEAVCTWEGGDSTSAFAIEDGVFEECDVEVKVTRKKR